MNSIVQKYHDTYAEYAERRNALESIMLKKRNQIQKLEQDVAQLESKRKALRSPSWVDCVEEIAAHLARLYNKEWKVYGPFGVRAECIIYLGDQLDFDVTKDACASLTVTAQFGEQVFAVRYDTGKVLKEYPANTIAAWNNFGNETKLLPDDFEEIYRLFVYHPAVKD